MNTRTLLLGLLASSLVACAIPEEDFPAKAGASACARLAECDAEDYEDIYGDDDAACVDDWSGIIEFYLDAGDLLGETYDEKKGRECVSEIRQADCSQIQNGEIDCDVWADE